MLAAVLLMVQEIPRADKIRQTVAEVQEERLERDLTALAEFGTRNSFSQRAPQVRRWLRERLEECAGENARVEEHPFEARDRRDHNRRTEGRNIFALIRGTDRPEEVVILGAHYDTWNLHDPDPDAPAPGANDNGSGTAAVLEAARVLARRTWRRSILLVLFDAEEHGLLGSHAFVPFVESLDLRIVGMVNNDIVGGGADSQRARIFSEGEESRRLARMGALLARLYADLEALPQPLLDRPGRGGDHIPFARRGHPAIRWIDEHETLEHQHTPTDTLDRLRLDHLTRIVRADIALLASLADGPPPPHVRATAGGGIEWDSVPHARAYLVAIPRANGLGWERIERTEQARHAARGDVAAVDDSGIFGPFAAPP